MGDVLKVGDIELYRDTHRVVVAGEDVWLTEFEFITLQTFVESIGGIISRDALRKIVGRDDYNRRYDTRAADKLISRLRLVLGDNGRDPQRILTVRGKGYKLVPKMD